MTSQENIRGKPLERSQPVIKPAISEDGEDIRCKNCGIVVATGGDYQAPRNYPQDCPRLGCPRDEGWA